ncbi:3-dehydroquinate synthase II family protein [uncultured Desulfovibrio sp.]|uniref:3-dehydroquinate synthase II family protein n=1 Tax=uncultured Desulfovibrio sp. TaxID=167968 RepID=UPI0025F00E5C|nr:3-dehydroquinate synthase II family protein [uncultured Desulfovibrio sp.]
MSRIYFRCVPYDKAALTLALESGVDGVIVPARDAAQAASLARCEVWADEETPRVALAAKADEEGALARLRAGERVVLASGWEVIPVENLLAQSDAVLAEAADLKTAQLAAGILERGVAGIVVPVTAAGELKAIVAQCKLAQGREQLVPARITRVETVGLGHRVCADTLSLLQRGQGMLVGNSSAFTFLVHAETEHNEYVAARPFRVNAGAVHAYVRLPHDRTTYLGELRAGQEVLVADADGATRVVTLGRVKIEVRPMLLIEAEAADADGPRRGAVFLQNAETIRLVTPTGEPVSVVTLSPGDEVLCRVDDATGGAGRHFGMRVAEDIREV